MYLIMFVVQRYNINQLCKYFYEIKLIFNVFYLFCIDLMRLFCLTLLRIFKSIENERKSKTDV
jgi:hypothetical protein